MCLVRAYPKGRSDAFVMHLYVKIYMYVNVNYIVKIQFKPERNRCTPGPPNTLLCYQPISDKYRYTSASIYLTDFEITFTLFTLEPPHIAEYLFES